MPPIAVLSALQRGHAGSKREREKDRETRDGTKVRDITTHNGPVQILSVVSTSMLC